MLTYLYIIKKKKYCLKKTNQPIKYEVFGDDQDVEATWYFNLAGNWKAFQFAVNALGCRDHLVWTGTVCNKRKE